MVDISVPGLRFFTSAAFGHSGMGDSATAIEVTAAGGGALVRLSGDWSLAAGVPEAEDTVEKVAGLGGGKAAFDTSGLGRWDSGLLVFLLRFEGLLEARGIASERDGLPEGVRNLLTLAAAVPEREGARGKNETHGLLTRLGTATAESFDGIHEAFEFLGEVVIAFGNLLRGRARFRKSDLFLFMQQAGIDALPIVSLISFLVGMILAFVGAVQLEQFGAAIYVANLVGVAMVREMGAMMTGIVMAGRTGAAYAAQLGSMKVTQEIDSLSTMGISPLEFLVLPRLLALALMMPLLTLYSDLIGILGGVAVGVGGLDLSPITYYQYTEWAVTLSDLIGGVVKAFVYGILIALCGCLRGLQSGNSSSAVGDATTSAVVSGIVSIICACGVFAVVFYVLDF